MGRYRDWYLMGELAAGVHSIQAEVYSFYSRSNGRLSLVCITIFEIQPDPIGREKRPTSPLGSAFLSGYLTIMKGGLNSVFIAVFRTLLWLDAERRCRGRRPSIG